MAESLLDQLEQSTNQDLALLVAKMEARMSETESELRDVKSELQGLKETCDACMY